MSASIIEAEPDHPDREQLRRLAQKVRRRLAGELTEDEFKLLRLLNGVYLQLHAYMLRIGIPYGTLSSDQLRALAYVARHYDRGYGHFTTQQNIQYNWIKLEQAGGRSVRLAYTAPVAHEQVGDPPGDFDRDPCTWYWYKDPADIPDRHWERYGLERSR